MTEWTQKALRAEAQKRLNDAEGCEYFAPDDAATLLVAELIGRCEQPHVDPFLEMAICADAASTFEDKATILREGFEAMLAERMGK